jgi:TonB-dependent starch-binding outer membrane protein SusC
MKKTLSGRRKCFAYLKKPIFTMMTILLALFINIFQVPADSQKDIKVSLSMKNTQIKEILNEIEKQTGCSFLYMSGDIDEKKKVTIHYLVTSLDTVLSDLFKDSNIAVIQRGNQIMLKKVENLNLLEKKSLISEQEDLQETGFDLKSLSRQNLTMTKATASPVKGKVTDDQGTGLPGVSVVVKGTTIGTVTDAEGNYTFEVPPGNDIIIFSFIGYQSQEISVGGRSVVDVKMLVDVQSLSEVVVVGYGEQKRATLTGSVASVKGADIIKTPVTNVSNSLAGRMAGIVAVTRSGEPGNDGSTIRIRGVNTLGNNDPLIIIDGIPGRSLDRIDPNSIENITVLKDASAAIYGSQAANGVILITTKRGKQGKPEISLNLNQGYGKPTRVPQMADAAEYATMLNEIEYYKSWNPNYTPKYTQEEIQKYRDGSDPWRYPNTNWFDEVLRPWSGQNYANLTVSGGSESLRYFVLFGGKSQDGYYKNSATKYTQYDFRSNLDGKISKNVSIGLDIAGRQENKKYPVRGAGSIFRMVMRGKPNAQAFWPNGMPGPDIEYGDNPVVVSTDATGYDRDTWYILNSNLKLNVTIPWVKGLSFNSNIGVDKGFRLRKRFETPWYLYSWDGSTLGADGLPVLTKGKKGFDDPRLTEETEFNQNILLNGLITYDRTFADVHGIKFMVGAERRTGNRDLFKAYRRYFASTSVDQLFAGGEKDMSNSGTAYQSARLNYFGRINYNYSEKYLLEFVWRYDGSYIFPENKRYGFFPGLSAGWRVSEENFWKDNVAFINNLKIRGSWGQTGNDLIDPYQYLATYDYGRWDATGDYKDETAFQNEPYIFGVSEENKALYEVLIPNRNVTWEIANQSNIGFEAQLLDNKLTLGADYFYNTRSQILWKRNASTPTSTGLTLPRENIGKVANKGFEFNIGYSDNFGGLKYQVSANGGYQKNKITFWDESPGRPGYQQSTGKSIPTDPLNPDNDLYYQANGIYDNEEEINSTPHVTGAKPGDIIFKDVNNDSKIDGNDRIRNDKTNIPRFTGGLTINLDYKGFDLTVFFQGAAGAVQYVSTESGEIGNFLKSFYDNRWTVDNPTASGPRTFNRDNEYWRNNRNTYFLRKTDYFRLKNVQLGYNLPPGIIERIGMKAVKIYVSGFNLLTYSPNFKDFDPETDSASGQKYPLQKVINGGLTLTF